MDRRQRTFFDDEFQQDMEVKRHARRSDPATSHQAAEDVVKSGRLSRQCQEILTRITDRWASSCELSEVALKYTSRLSDLRQRGYKIDTKRSDEGWWYYRLAEKE